MKEEEEGREAVESDGGVGQRKGGRQPNRHS